jgi:hypothetical protein
MITPSHPAGAPAAARARAVTGTLAQAESLAQLCRDHGHPARVVVGRKRGTIRIRVAGQHAGDDWRAFSWQTYMLPVDRAAVREWLGY